MICFAKPELTENLYVVQKEELSITCYVCNTYTRQKAKHIHKKQWNNVVHAEISKGQDQFSQYCTGVWISALSSASGS
jgi:hypothetical protein